MIGPLLRATLGDPAMLMSSGKRHDPIPTGTMQLTRTTRDALTNGETLDLDCENASVTLQHHGSIHFRSNAGTVNIQADPVKLWRAVVDLCRDARHEWNGDRKPMIIQALDDIQGVINETREKLAKIED